MPPHHRIAGVLLCHDGPLRPQRPAGREPLQVARAAEPDRGRGNQGVERLRQAHRGQAQRAGAHHRLRHAAPQSRRLPRRRRRDALPGDPCSRGERQGRGQRRAAQQQPPGLCVRAALGGDHPRARREQDPTGRPRARGRRGPGHRLGAPDHNHHRGSQRGRAPGARAAAAEPLGERMTAVGALRAARGARAVLDTGCEGCWHPLVAHCPPGAVWCAAPRREVHAPWPWPWWAACWACGAKLGATSTGILRGGGSCTEACASVECFQSAGGVLDRGRVRGQSAWVQAGGPGLGVQKTAFHFRWRLDLALG
mmetsp:Transcript_7539/g.25624  ORF Transcript_7539/g.25624 Transcript_7539/m.25624 type:complete len:310 (-) Transcript_7539:165-1094(-)